MTAIPYLWPVPSAADPVTEYPGRVCWQCRGKFLEADFANGRCITCTTSDDRRRTARLAFRVITRQAYAPLSSRHLSAWRLMARGVERQAELEGIDASISASDTETWGEGWPR